jgi:Leucine-rich repeat (LRR) protein
VAEVSGLASLQELNLRNNEISTIVNFDSLENLQRLFLGGNNLSEPQCSFYVKRYATYKY